MLATLVRWRVRALFACGAIAPPVTVLPVRLAAQAAGGVVAGRVADSSGTPVTGASVRVRGTRTGAMVDDAGHYRLGGLAAGTYALDVRRIGFTADSFTLHITPGATVTHNVTLRPAAAVITGIRVLATGEQGTRAAVIDQVRQAPTIETAIGAHEITALPNANAAAAAARLPGVTTEMSEGESKFVQVRGTEPRLANVTIDGAHVPGTEQGARNPRLDDIPAGLINELVVRKTLTADMDADAIGGTVDIVTAAPEGRPHGSISGEAGHGTLLGARMGDATLSYGGRLGGDQRFGFQIGASVDRNDRAVNDLEPTWASSGQAGFFPSEFSLQADAYTRTRYGANAGFDYRPSPSTTLYVKGLYSRFLDHGTLYVYDVGDGNGTPLAPPIVTGATLYRQSQALTPTDQVYSTTLGGRTASRRDTLSYRLSVSGTTEDIVDFRATPFNFGSRNGTATMVRYDIANPNAPTFSFPETGMASAVQNPANYYLAGFQNDNTRNRAHAYGAQVDYATPQVKFGVKVRDEGAAFTNTSYAATYTGADLTLAPFVGSFRDPGFYGHIHHFALGPVPDDRAVRAYEDAHLSLFPRTLDTLANALGSFQGREHIYAAYALGRVTAGPLAINAGLRVERTDGTYSGHDARVDGSTGSDTFHRSYTDLFPSLDLKLALGEASDVRLSGSRAIGRPNYSDLAPSVAGLVGDPATVVNIGNPNLRPERAWNVDFEAEHFFSSSGVVSVGTFYKAIDHFIFVRSFPGYRVPPFNDGPNYRAGQPQNGAAGHLLGLELSWNQRLPFLPGFLSGLGLEANGTLITSSASLPTDSGSGTRHARLPRQSPWLANIALVYERGPLEVRSAWAFQAASIASYGDGTSNPATGDQYFYDHGEVDASIEWKGMRDLEIELEAQNLTDAVFGFYAGTPANHYSFQREYYGRTFSIGLKRSF